MQPTYEELKEFADKIDSFRDNLDELKKSLQETHMREVKGQHLFYYDTPAGRPLFATEIRISDLIASVDVLNDQYRILWSYVFSLLCEASKSNPQVDKP